MIMDDLDMILYDRHMYLMGFDGIDMSSARGDRS